MRTFTDSPAGETQGYEVMMICVNPRCGRKHNQTGKRGLCYHCYRVPAIRDATPRICRRADDGETMAQLDARIAAAMQCLPAWWARESRRLGNHAVTTGGIS